MAKKKSEKVDGISAKDWARIRAALRDVWRYTHPWKLVTQRCLLPNGFSKCEKCKKKCPKVSVDHITPIGETDFGIIERMFVSSTKMQGLCKDCHSVKTKADNKKTRATKKAKKSDPIGDFF